jgi:hypothetical protein
MKIYIKILTLLTLCYLCNACQLYEEKRKSGTIAVYNGKTITQEQISKITAGLNPQDSARIAQQYIQQWATNLIEYDVAKDQTNKNIEQLVEDYRRSLYLHEYETRLIAQRMPRIIEDTLIQTFYQTHQQHLVLSETILQGLLLVVPNQAPKLDELRKKIQHPEIEENIEWLEKFAYQYAVGYELFTDDWKTTSELFVLMPLEQNNLDKQLKNKRQIEVQDSINTYLLQVTDLYMKGDEKPITYARKEIEEILLRQRQVEFLQQERNKLYENAIETGKLKLYENE